MPQNENLTKNRFAISLDHLIPIESLDHLIPIEVYGRKFMAPPNPEVYLKKKYGKNWRIPDIKQFYWNKSKFK